MKCIILSLFLNGVSVDFYCEQANFHQAKNCVPAHNEVIVYQKMSYDKTPNARRVIQDSRCNIIKKAKKGVH